jgi:hypothetical protein
MPAEPVGQIFFKTVSRELAKYNSDLVAVREVRWEKGGTELADNNAFYCGNGNADVRRGSCELQFGEQSALLIGSRI